MDRLRARLYTLLRRSELYLKTDMVYLARGGFWLTLGQVFVAAASFFSAIVFAHLIPKETYGTYRYILSAIGIFGVFTLIGAPTAVARSTAQGFEGTLPHLFMKRMRWGVLMLLVAGGVSAYYYLHGNTVLAAGFLIAAPFYLLIGSGQLYSSFLTGKKDFKRKSIYDSSVSIIPILATAGTALIAPNPIALIATYFGSTAAVSFYLYLKVRRTYRTDTGTIDPSATRYAVHVTFMGAIGQVAGNLDSLLVWNHLGAAPLAIYAFSSAIPTQMRVALGNLSQLTFPKFAHQSREEIRKNLPVKMMRVFLVVLAIVVIYIIAAPFIFSLFFPKYIEAVLYSQMYALSLLFLPKDLINNAMGALADTRRLYIFNIVSPILRISFLFAFVPLWGIVGAIGALILSQTVEALMLWYFLLKF